MRDSVGAGATGVLAAAAFTPAASFGFVYDDHRFYAENQHLGHASILWRAFADPTCQTADGTEAGLWRPLRTLSFALDRSLFGGAAVGPHLVNALLHGAGTACVFGLLRRFGASSAAAALGAALYALHPAQVECVAWISSRGDLLAAALTWGSLLLMLSGRTGLALAAGAAALLAKEQAVVWPALAWIAARMVGDDAKAALKKAAWPAAVAAAFVVVRWALLAEPTQQGGLGAGPARGPQMAAMLGHQAWSTLLPVGTLFDWQMPPGRLPWPVLLVACAALAAAASRPTRLAALWFLAALVPTLFLQAFVPLNILVADRFLLFALPALAYAVSRAVDDAGPAPAVAAALCFGVLTETSLPTWRDDDTLWGETAARAPDDPRAQDWLGTTALRRGDVEAAEARFRSAVLAGPGDAKARYHLACALEAKGRSKKDPKAMADAYAEFSTAIALLAEPRAESRREILLLATLASVDVELVVGDDEAGACAARSLVGAPRPAVPESIRDAWASRIESIARSAEVHPLLGGAFAAKAREWGRLP